MANTNRKRIYLDGQTFGRLTVLHEVEPTSHLRRRWQCKCICGQDAVVHQSNLLSGHTQSCGCLSAETTSKRRRTHGYSGTSIYQIWNGMRERCHNPNHEAWRYYGGKGITVCDRWTKFEYFLEDMGERPSVEHSIERRNNKGNYEPANCYWGTQEEQCSNRSSNVHITLNGVTMTAMRWARQLNINDSTLLWRIHRGWSDEKTLTTPVRSKRQV